MSEVWIAGQLLGGGERRRLKDSRHMTEESWRFSRYPVVRTYYIASGVLLKPSALSGCSLAAYVSAMVSSSGSVPSGNIVSPHNVRM